MVITEWMTVVLSWDVCFTVLSSTARHLFFFPIVIWQWDSVYSIFCYWAYMHTWIFPFSLYPLKLCGYYHNAEKLFSRFSGEVGWELASWQFSQSCDSDTSGRPATSSVPQGWEMERSSAEKEKGSWWTIGGPAICPCGQEGRWYPGMH